MEFTRATKAQRRDLLLANPQLRFAGVHAHIGSQIYDESAYLENASALVAAAERFATFGLQSERS